ncbi:glutathione S-transferase C-terminal-like protein [Thelephora ganbajun]|uniref:Glutathione S-transferase C-terminal-like protein n=1 Tax=Thelephora ganbajun TaxID=370292 RepID=A0ACB6ZRA6_THEGA|nr:glutathione S-transferase C-terminal-like protein [Thelephora ganbajun]
MSTREVENTEERLGKRQKTGSYVIHYWDGVPGRAEYIRLIFEYTGTPYDEVKDNATLMTRVCDPGTVGIPPNLWPPALELPNGKWLGQTGVLVNYLSPKLGLAGYAKDDTDLDEDEKAYLSAKNAQLFFTVLDLFDEVHKVHHVVSSELYYEDQKAEALRAAEPFRAFRLPKYLQHFQSVLETNPANKDGKGPFLLSNLTTAADLALFHNLTGLEFSYPKRLKNLQESGKYELVFKLQERVQNEPKIAEYMKSNRRQQFSFGIFRNFPELDNEE